MLWYGHTRRRNENYVERRVMDPQEGDKMRKRGERRRSYGAKSSFLIQQRSKAVSHEVVSDVG